MDRRAVFVAAVQTAAMVEVIRSNRAPSDCIRAVVVAGQLAEEDLPSGDALFVAVEAMGLVCYFAARPEEAGWAGPPAWLPERFDRDAERG